MSRKKATKIMTGLQSYIHFRYSNYNAHDNVTLNRDNLLSLLDIEEEKATISTLEKRLKKYYIKNSEGKMMGKVPQAVLDRFEAEIEEKFSRQTLDRVINYETLGNQNSKFAQDKERNFERLVSLGTTKFRLKTAIKAVNEIKQRVQFLQDIQTKDSVDKTLSEIDSLINSLQSTFTTDTWVPRQTDVGQRLGELIEQLNGVVSGGSSKIHGAYAEYVVALMTAVTEKRGKKAINQMIKDFEHNLQNIGGAYTHAAFSTKEFFGEQNAEEIMRRKQVYDEGSGIIYTTNATPEKVDVNIQFNGSNIGASVKNINMANTKFPDIGLHTGIGILALLNQEARFVNHWLNISPVREGGPEQSKEVSSEDKEKVDNDMKFAIAYRAFAGGRTISTGENSELAKIFILNDNSTGRFRVFAMKKILSDLQNNLDLIKITTSPDLFKMKNVWLGENNDNDPENAYRRVTAMLAQLNATSLHVSVSKAAF